MATKRARGLNHARLATPEISTIPTLADGTRERPAMRVRLDGTDELGTLAWTTREKDGSWTGVVSWDARAVVRLDPPRAKQPLRALVAA